MKLDHRMVAAGMAAALVLFGGPLLAQSKPARESPPAVWKNERNFNAVQKTWEMVADEKYVEAEATYREGLELVPRDFRGGFETMRLTLYLGNAVRTQGRFAEAERICRRGLELIESCDFPSRADPDYWKSCGLYYLARALEAQGKLEESAGYCRNAKALGNETWAPRAEELLAEMNGKPSSD